MGLAYPACHTVPGPHLQRLSGNSSHRPLTRGLSSAARANCATAGASFPSGRIVLASDRHPHLLVRPGASASNGVGSPGSDFRPGSAEQPTNGVGATTTIAAASQSAQEPPSNGAGKVLSAAAPQQQPIFTPVPEDVIAEFEHKLEADLQTVGVTLTAILGVIIFWRGVWSLLDHFIGDSVVGDICCIIVGLTIVLYIRLSGMKIASFWPPS